MNAGEILLGKLLDGHVHYMIPLFQRLYSWEKHNWQTLWLDILETRDMEGSPKHFLGSVVSKAFDSSISDRMAAFLVIDGQQRLTTLTILLAALRDAAHEDPGLGSEIEERYLINKFAKDPLKRYKVLPTQSDREAYFAVIDGNGKDAPTSKIRDAYHYFLSQFEATHKEGSISALQRLEEVITGQLELVGITLQPTDNEYRIFESLNAKGAPLTQADLIRNYIFMRIPANEQESAYQKLWRPMQDALKPDDVLEDFFRYEFMSDGEFVRQGDVYQEWKKRLEKPGQDDWVQKLKTLAYRSKFYKRLVDPTTEANPEIRDALVRLNRWGAETIYPFLLYIYRQYDTGKVDAKGVAAILRMIESFLVRRLFTNKPTNALNRLFMRLSQQLPPGVDLVAGTRQALTGRDRAWPTDEEFYAGVLKYPLYQDSRSDQRRMILEAFEINYGHKERPSFDSPTIEHVMPQTLTPEWEAMLGPDAALVHHELLHVVGNLTLSALNSEMGNKPFAAKKDTLSSSNFEMNKEIAKESEWTAAQIRARSERLAKRALTIWPGPA
jgi:hypothetical protein